MRRLSLVLLACFAMAGSALAAEKPNILYILCDDLGYGDVHCLNPQGKIPTPNMDRLRDQGTAFTEAHSSSAVCTPTRYGILTGRYNWRTRLQQGVLGGYSPPLIAADRLTVARMLQEQGYHTGCIGKWHLGMNMATKNGRPANAGNVDWSAPIHNGPTTVGFDYFFGISASLDMAPFVFIENDHFTKPATATKKWIRAGAAAEDFEAIDVVPILAAKAQAFIRDSAPGAKNGSKPFFLYLAMTSPHTPIVPTSEFAGKSGINAYADFVMETDHYIGQVLQALDDAQLADKTLVIFASDNGCSPAANFPELLQHGHNPSYVFRGMKSDIWDGGHHIPFIVRWPGHIKPGSATDQVVCLTDFMATAADIVGVKLPPTAAEDSVSLLPILLGKDKGPIHEAIVHHSIDGMFAIRDGQWKLELCPGSGGWSKPRDAEAVKENLPPMQLYDMSNDIGEKSNVVSANPSIVARLTKLLETYVNNGRSTPGEPQHNDVPVNIHKKPKPLPPQPGD